MTYQEQAMHYAKYEGNVEYPFLALSEEVGEVSGKLAKYVRKNNVGVVDAIMAASNPTSLPERQLHDDLIYELGDVLWQLAACAQELGVTLETIQNYNLAKLAGREARNTIIGEGDKR